MATKQLKLFEDDEIRSKAYSPYLTATENGKGVLDVDTVKGCALGMEAYPKGGCYGECYAYKTAHRYGIDFTKSVSRKVCGKCNDIFKIVKSHHAGWYRVGTTGDPCHDWDNTIEVLKYLQATGKTPVISTKHWIELTDEQLVQIEKIGAVINTSISALDSDTEISHRLEQRERIKSAGIKSVLRVVTCEFGRSKWAIDHQELQEYLLSFDCVIDNPLRASKTNKRVKNGDIVLIKKKIQ